MRNLLATTIHVKKSRKSSGWASWQRVDPEAAGQRVSTVAQTSYNDLQPMEGCARPCAGCGDVMHRCGADTWRLDLQAWCIFGCLRRKTSWPKGRFGSYGEMGNCSGDGGKKVRRVSTGRRSEATTTM